MQDIRATRFSPDRFGLPANREAEAVIRAFGQEAPTKDSGASLPVVANHGRWIVECPCGSAQVASRTDRRFYCVECGNVVYGGGWVAVEWPKNHKAIEDELDKRLLVKHRNWRPGETLQELRAETKLTKSMLKNLVRK